MWLFISIFLANYLLRKKNHVSNPILYIVKWIGIIIFLACKCRIFLGKMGEKSLMILWNRSNLRM